MTINKVHDQYEITDTFQNELVKGNYTIDADGNKSIFMEYNGLTASYDKNQNTIGVWGEGPSLISFSRYFTNLIETVINNDSE